MSLYSKFSRLRIALFNSAEEETENINKVRINTTKEMKKNEEGVIRILGRKFDNI